MGGASHRRAGLALSVALCLSTLCAGCISLDGYACDASEQCVLGGQQGVCQPTGYCSYPDEECDDSGLRYEAYAGDGNGGLCVPGAATSAADSTSDSGSDATGTDGPWPDLTSSGADSTGDGTGDTTTGDTGDSADTGNDDGPPPCGGFEEACCDGDLCETGLYCAGLGCGCVVELGAGSRHSCATKLDGSMWCWGSNEFNQLGFVGGAVQLFPTEVGAPFTAADPVLQIAADEHTCVRRSTNQLLCWGRNDSGQVNGAPSDTQTVPTSLLFAAPATALGVGLAHTCAYVDLVGVKCWGSNSNGQLGTTAGLGAPGPVDVVLPEPTVGLALGARHSCALSETGLVRCWGANDFGQLGQDPLGLGDTPNPVLVNLPEPALGIVSGREHVCAQLAEAVYCWGRNEVGELGDGIGASTHVPAQVLLDAIGGIADLSAGARHTCAVDEDGFAWCWGDNGFGQIGLEPDMMGFDEYTLVPVLTGGLQHVLQVRAGRTHTCSLTEEAALSCWGTNSVGQVGDGTDNYAFDPSPVELDCP